MTVFRRITQFLTPPPMRKPSGQEPVDWTEPQQVSASMLRPILQSLLAGQPPDEFAPKRSLSDLREIATRYGAYPTASEIQNCLARMPEKDSEGVAYKKGRGYELAASLYTQHLNKEIDGVEGKSKPLGPNLFEEFVRELVECLFKGQLVRRGVEITIVTVEKLLSKAVDSFEYRELYLTLAHRCVECTIASSLEKVEADLEAANRAARRYEKGESPPPTPSSPLQTLDQELIAYLKNMETRVEVIKEGFTQFPMRPAMRGTGSEQKPDQKTIRRHLEYLHGLMQIVNDAGYRPLLGLLKERGGVLREQVSKGAGVDFLRSAAGDYEWQGDKEASLHLVNLSRKRYARAANLYRRVGDAAKAEKNEVKARGLQSSSS